MLRNQKQEVQLAYSISHTVVDLWILGRVADFLENSGFTRVGTADDENSEPSKCLFDVFGLHSVWVRVTSKAGRCSRKDDRIFTRSD